VSDPTTAAGRALLEAFTARAIDAPDAIHLNAESIIRHAIPRIEAEAYERGCVAGMAMEKFAATPAPLDVDDGWQERGNPGDDATPAPLDVDDWPPPGVHRHGDGCGHLRPTPWSPR
jgi:hypothetical protein